MNATDRKVTTKGANDLRGLLSSSLREAGVASEVVPGERYEMTDKKKEPDASEQNADIKKVYKADRRQRAPHLIDLEEQNQIEKLRRSVVEAVKSGEGQKALDILKQMGYGPGAAEYKAVIALLYPPSRKK
jgi:hypothetical protein